MKHFLLFLAFLVGGYGQSVPASFFAESTRSTSHMPSVSFSGLRVWDTGITWNAIEQSNGVYNWTTLDTFLTAAAAAGADVNINLAGTPNWASSAPGDTNCASNFSNNAPTANGACDPPSDIATGDNYWKTFVTAVVQHSLASSAGHIKSYSIWNEPNQDATHATRFWVGTNAQLVTLAADAAAIIHALDPAAVVVSPEPTDDGRFPNGPSDWFSPYFAAGGTTLQDAIGFHYYPHDQSGNYGADPELRISFLDNLKSLLAANGLSAKPIYVTEGNWGNISTLTPAQEAAWMVKYHLLLLHKGVSRVFWYQWDNGSATGNCSAPWGKMWDASLGVCPAGSAYQWLQSYLVNATPAQPFCSNGGDDTWSCLFGTSAGKTAQFLWNSNTTDTQTITLDARFNACWRIDGTACTITNHSVAVNASPVLLLMN